MRTERGHGERAKSRDARHASCGSFRTQCAVQREREFFTGNPVAQIHVTIVMIRWTGLAPWEFEFPFPGSRVSTFLACAEKLAAKSRYSFRFRNNCQAEMQSGSAEGSYLRLVDLCITQL